MADVFEFELHEEQKLDDDEIGDELDLDVRRNRN
jgi:hypothetical protein